jgi:hypothetical protein
MVHSALSMPGIAGSFGASCKNFLLPQMYSLIQQYSETASATTSKRRT